MDNWDDKDKDSDSILQDFHMQKQLLYFYIGFT